MTEKNQHEKNAAERQVELLINALKSARQNGGVWLNPSSKTAPQFYPKGATVSPFNSLILALHSDQNGYKTNLYTLFSEAKKAYLSSGITGMSMSTKRIPKIKFHVQII